jgi:hypothetical protein
MGTDALSTMRRCAIAASARDHAHSITSRIL